MRAGILITHAIPPPSFLLSNHPHEPPDIYNNIRAEKYTGVNRERKRHSRRIIWRRPKTDRVDVFFPCRTRKSCHVPFPPDERSQESSYLYIVLSRARTFATALYGRFLRPYASRFSERPVSRRFTARIRRELHFCSSEARS